MEIRIYNLDTLNKQLKAIGKSADKVIEKTVQDVKKRAPSWVSQCVTDVYNIKKSEINSTLKSGKSVGNVRIEGDTIKSLRLVYTGRTLTPTHFSMTPKAPPIGRSYKLTMQVKKGQKKLIGRYSKKRRANGPYSNKSHNILMSTRTNKADGVKYIPFQRVSKRRLDIVKLKTTSIPQMITSDDVSKAISKRLSNEMSKRYEHHIKQERKNKW